MPIPDTGRGRPRATASLHARVLALVATVLLLAACALVGAPAAQALPKGAYWYSLLDLPQAWQLTEGAGVTVGLVDSGVQADLGDLQGQVLPGLDLTGQDPGVRRDDPVSSASAFGHGTDMAVYIAGTGKGAGIVGVAPKAKILPVDTTSSDDSSDTDIARGVRWTVDHGAKVVNLSLGSAKSCAPVIEDSLRYAYQHDVIVVASAGDSPGAVNSPANCAGALAVSGVDAAIKPWTKSASGPETAFAAPAYGLINEYIDGKLNGPNPDTSGTSASAAMVSGTFALLRARFPTESARQIVTRALYNVHNGVGDTAFGTRVGNALGYGMILPRYALTDAPPANAKNPIYDQWARDFAGSTGSTGASGASGVSSTSVPALSGPTSSPSAAAAGSGGGGISPVVVIVVVVVVIGVVVAVVAVTRRRGGPRGSAGSPPARGR